MFPFSPYTDGFIVQTLFLNWSPNTPPGDPWEALDRIRETPPDVVLCGGELPPLGLDRFIEEARRLRRDLPVIVKLSAISETQSLVELSARLTRLGASGILPAAADEAQVQREIERVTSFAHREMPPENERWLRYLVGSSPAMERVTGMIRLVAARRATVLISGESGTGKEMAARALHEASGRTGEFIAVNCGAIPETLLESELFGHAKGAFTGSVASRAGRFEQAQRGTIFLDEIGELPLELQAKLLRVLQEREVQRLGSGEVTKLDVRVIAATNADLPEQVANGRFREDLYYRLNVVPLEMPPLRHRAGDLPVLARHFVEKICRQEDLPMRTIPPETLQRMQAYAWPGNVRQLENAIETAIALSGDRDSLTPSDFSLPSADRVRVATTEPAPVAIPENGLDYEQVVATFEAQILEQALRRSNGNKSQAAEMLRLKRTTLTAKLKSLSAAVGRPI
jgi:DNA-binding NtrC family response regulator